MSNTRGSTRTLNGMSAHATSNSKNIDFFFAVGGSRGKNITPLFMEAVRENEDLAVRILQWSRDVRGGAGERRIFRDILQHCAQSPKLIHVASRLLPKVAEIGRWDDLLVLMGTPLESDVALLIGTALGERNGLAAKWMPRKGPIASRLREHWDMTPKEYRKLLVMLTNVVETAMCSKDWESIDFGKVPSVAAARYQRAFDRNTGERYKQYRAALASGTAKINASAVYPYDVIKSVANGLADVADAQWKALPDYTGGTDERAIVVADTSGSMTCPAGNNPRVTCLDVCISLAMYTAERLTGPFKDAFITFSTKPTLQQLTGTTLQQRYRELARASWSMSTDLTAAMDAILQAGVRHKLPKSEMPTKIILISDMQFNQCVTRSNHTAIKAIASRFEAAGYDVPSVVFWNVKHYEKTMPATVDEQGVALVSGCSPSILSSVLGSKPISPIQTLLDTVMVERYDW